MGIVATRRDTSSEAIAACAAAWIKAAARSSSSSTFDRFVFSATVTPSLTSAATLEGAVSAVLPRDAPQPIVHDAAGAVPEPRGVRAQQGGARPKNVSTMREGRKNQGVANCTPLGCLFSFFLFPRAVLPSLLWVVRFVSFYSTCSKCSGPDRTHGQSEWTDRH